MKKILSLALALCLCLGTVFTLASCDKGVNEDEWKAMLAAPNFENYTLSQSGPVTYVSGQMTETSTQELIIKITADKVHLDAKIDGEAAHNKVYTGEEAAEQKKGYEEVFLAVLADFNNFTYNKDEKVYENPNAVTVNLEYASIGTGATATVTMENGKVSLTEDGKLLKFTCHLTQTTTYTIPEVGEQSITATTDMTWQFSDYGTTAIAE